MVSVASLKSSTIQHETHLVNYGAIYFKIDDKAAYASRRGYLVVVVVVMSFFSGKDTPMS